MDEDIDSKFCITYLGGIHNERKTLFHFFSLKQLGCICFKLK